MGNTVSRCFGVQTSAVIDPVSDQNHCLIQALNVNWADFGPAENAHRVFATQGRSAENWSAAARYVSEQMQQCGLNSQINTRLFTLLKRLGFSQIEHSYSAMDSAVAEQAFLPGDISSLLRTVSTFLLKIHDLLENLQDLPDGHEKSRFLDNLELHLLQALDGVELCSPGILSRLSHFLSVSDLINSANPVNVALNIFKNQLLEETVLSFYLQNSSVPLEIRAGNDVHYLHAVKRQMAEPLGLVFNDTNDVYANALQEYAEHDLNAGLREQLQGCFSPDALFFLLGKQCIEDFKNALNQFGVRLPIKSTEWLAMPVGFEQIMPQIHSKYGPIKDSLFIKENSDDIDLQNNPTLIALQLAENAGIFFGSESENTKTLFQFGDRYCVYEIKQNDSLTWLDVTHRGDQSIHRENYCHHEIVGHFKNIGTEEIVASLNDALKQRWLEYFFHKVCDEKNSEIVQKLLHIPYFMDLAQLRLVQAVDEGWLDALNYLKEQGVVLSGDHLLCAERMLFNSICQGELIRVIDLLKVCPNKEIVNENGLTPVFIAVDHGQSRILRALIEAGADANTKCLNGFSPLMWAITQENIDIVDYLISQGANLNDHDYEGATALMIAAKSIQPDILQCLIHAGADVNATDNEGWTAMNWLYSELMHHTPDYENTQNFQACLNILQGAGGVMAAVDDL